MDQGINAALLAGFSGTREKTTGVWGPRIITNEPGEELWNYLRFELEHCTRFRWMIAFVTPAMLVPLKAVLADQPAGVTGQIITGTYAGFNPPAAFYELNKLPGVTARVATSQGFHAKGYAFTRKTGEEVLFTGSANFTKQALLTNRELTLRVVGTTRGTVFQEFTTAFEAEWKQAHPITPAWIKDYAATYHPLVTTSLHQKPTQKVTPNKMQQEALATLQASWKRGEHRTLVVSATGTGKTYLGAFAVQAFQPRRFLFIVHREEIALKARKSFQRVLGGPASAFGILSGHRHDWDAQYLFATVQTMAQERIQHHFSPTTFDFILIDEAHRAPAPSYQRVMNYFTPQFWLGMTATPERMDDADVYALFDYHVAYEIRLRTAIDSHMVCPFDYVGVADYTYQGRIIDEQVPLKRLAAPARVEYVLQQLAYYGTHGPVHGLVFCSRQAEAKKIAAQFTAADHPAVALTNTDGPTTRARAVQDLEAGRIEYIMTVDLFNEGIDIPCVNQVVMLRSTQSPVVFTQQLGRGLRWATGKTSVLVLDFIGNYKNNYMIPIALTGHLPAANPAVRDIVAAPPTMGITTINFTRVARERILRSLEQTKVDALVHLKQAYQTLKQRFGRVPLLHDFAAAETVSPRAFTHQTRVKNYNQFLARMKDDRPLTKWEDQVLTFITQELVNGLRPHELVLLRLLLENDGVVTERAYKEALNQYHAATDPATLTSVMGILNLSFFDVTVGKTTRKKQYGNQAVVVQMAAGFAWTEPMVTALRKHDWFRCLVTDTVITGLQLVQKADSRTAFTRGREYTRKDVCRLLNWPKDISAPLYGYRVIDGVCPIFITVKKATGQRSARYKNDLRSGDRLRWYTRSPRTLRSPEVQELLAGVSAGHQQVKMLLFVKRDDGRKAFTYLGEVKVVPTSIQEEVLNGKKTVGMDLQLEHVLTLDQYRELFTD
ncbi:DUF3427 domain-containing protein [Ligilactobacillus sp. LYQ60]|uniref:DUF3427 domain-containing protein n=1 Tax=unclassified Ligilactobacillus TaxID=2767920 RepID=UPI003853BC33